MQAKTLVISKLSVPLHSYKLNRSKILFVTALAIHKGCFGKVCYCYRVNAAYQCLRELVHEFSQDPDLMRLGVTAFHRLKKTAEAVPKPNNILN